MVCRNSAALAGIRNCFLLTQRYGVPQIGMPSRTKPPKTEVAVKFTLPLAEHDTLRRHAAEKRISCAEVARRATKAALGLKEEKR